MKLLFVCTGNMCRSPMIKFMADEYALSLGLDIVSDSAGMMDHYKDMSPETETVLKENRVPHTRNISKPLSRELFDKADFVFPMTEDHKKRIESAFGKSRKIVPLSVFYGKDVPDPYGKGIGAYRETYKIFARILPDIMEYAVKHQ